MKKTAKIYKVGGQQLQPNRQLKQSVIDRYSAYNSVKKSGGFDVVIGNPPHGAELNKFEREYFNKKFSINNTDTAALLVY